MFYIIFYTIVFSVHFSWSAVLLVLRASICAINIFWMSEWMNKSWPALERIKNESSVTFLPKLSIFFSSIFNWFNSVRFLFLLTLWLQQFQLHFYQLCETPHLCKYSDFSLHLLCIVFALQAWTGTHFCGNQFHTWEAIWWLYSLLLTMPPCYSENSNKE